ncbi:hypothetical protein D9M69_588530 [compost metagenome]
MTRHVDIVAGRIIFNDFDITDQRCAGIAAFEQVVAEKRVLWNAIFQRNFKGVDIVKTLTGEGAFTQKILIGIGNGKDIRINAAIDRENALQE